MSSDFGCIVYLPKYPGSRVRAIEGLDHVEIERLSDIRCIAENAYGIPHVEPDVFGGVRVSAHLPHWIAVLDDESGGTRRIDPYACLTFGGTQFLTPSSHELFRVAPNIKHDCRDARL